VKPSITERFENCFEKTNAVGKEFKFRVTAFNDWNLRAI
jgi:hypothetical protein